MSIIGIVWVAAGALLTVYQLITARARKAALNQLVKGSVLDRMELKELQTDHELFEYVLKEDQAKLKSAMRQADGFKRGIRKALGYNPENTSVDCRQVIISLTMVCDEANERAASFRAQMETLAGAVKGWQARCRQLQEEVKGWAFRCAAEIERNKRPRINEERMRVLRPVKEEIPTVYLTEGQVEEVMNKKTSPKKTSKKPANKKTRRA